ncbi:NADP oxidoreductase [Halostagnicola sp. A56]|uniref:NADP oxidoreductase n=1 Tax=Halostagnicola sp. A56 TaxID=1495067 RepID=UPI001E337F90|nr:NADP oxidoreductase [Halostagnicola sp. A56]
MSESGPVIRIAGSDPNQDLLRSVPTADFPVVNVGSTGIAAVEPLLVATRAGTTAFYERCSAERLEAVVSSVDETGDIAAAEPDAVVEHEQNPSSLPDAQLPGLRTGDRDVLGACGWRRPTDPADHEAAGGFVDPIPETVLETGTNLRGRGWGDLCHDDPVGETWRSVRAGDGDKAVVVNAHGNPADTLLLSSAPFDVLEGAVALARTVDAERIVVYASADDDRAVEVAREAIENYPDLSVDIDVLTGPAAYRAAEPSMAIESIEGNHRLEARIRPPDLDEVGLFGQPTLVHTPRTVAHLAVALRTGSVPQTRVVTVTSDDTPTAAVEVPETETLETVVDAVDVSGSFKAAAVGGTFGGITSDLDVGVGPDALSAADLGTEGVVHLLTDDRCVVEFVGQRTQYGESPHSRHSA